MARMRRKPVENRRLSALRYHSRQPLMRGK